METGKEGPHRLPFALDLPLFLLDAPSPNAVATFLSSLTMDPFLLLSLSPPSLRRRPRPSSPRVIAKAGS